MSKSAVFTRSIMGRVPTILGVFNLRPLASPVTTRIAILLQYSQSCLHFINKVILLGPGDQCLSLIHLQFFECRNTPNAKDEFLQPFLSDLVAHDVTECLKAFRAGNGSSLRFAQFIDLATCIL